MPDSATMVNQIQIGELNVSRMGLGTNRITDTPQARALLQYAVQAGINFIDTAHLYAGGASETTIGNTLAPYPDELVVATKGGYDNRPDYNSEEFLRANLEESLRRLQADRITLYQLHLIDPNVPLARTMKVLKSFQDEGRVQYIGLSEADVTQIEEARQYVDIVSVQNEYSLAERKHEPVVDYCTENNIAFMPWFPLRHLSQQQMATLAEIADNHEATAEQIALAWLLQRSPQMLPIPGTLSQEHLKQNLDALKIELSDEEYERIDNTGEYNR